MESKSRIELPHTIRKNFYLIYQHKCLAREVVIESDEVPHTVQSPRTIGRSPKANTEDGQDPKTVRLPVISKEGVLILTLGIGGGAILVVFRRTGTKSPEGRRDLGPDANDQDPGH